MRLAYAKESIPDGPEGIILESVMEGYAEYYSENLSQNVKRGFYDSALELKTLGQRVLGLRKSPDDHFEIEPATAPLVRRIFEEYAAGTPAKTIFTQLNDEGYHTSTGGSFNKNSIRRIVQNEKYIGIYEYKDIRVENAIPAIVDKNLFDRCQRMLARHKHSPAAHRNIFFLLTTKLFCGHCGQPMVGDSGTSKNGNTYYYYTCKGHRAHKCSKMRVQQDWIEQLDVQLTNDNQLAVFHDYDLSMRTNGTGAFSDWNMADLKKLDIGYGYTADNGQTYPFGLMPELGEVLAAFPNRELLIHINHGDVQTGQVLWSYLENMSPERLNQITVYGDENALKYLREQNSDIRVLSIERLKQALLKYELWGWTGYIPEEIKNMELHIPLKYAKLLWG